MGRYFSLLQRQLRTSLLVAAQYRWDFVLDAALSTFWTVTAVIPLLVVYSGNGTIPGWTLSEALVVIGWFILLQGVLEGAINPGLTAVVDHIRKGTLDFVLLKPADAQFLVSTSRFAIWRITSVVMGLLIFGYAFHRLGRWPSALGIGQAAFLALLAIGVLYSLWILIVSLAFYVVKVDNLTYLFTSIFDAARWPSTVFRGVLHLVFTFIVPLALMTTYPAEALLGRLQPNAIAGSVVGTAVLAVVSRQIWLLSIRRYTSASS